jgi:hypothetical protein
MSYDDFHDFANFSRYADKFIVTDGTTVGQKGTGITSAFESQGYELALKLLGSTAWCWT